VFSASARRLAGIAGALLGWRPDEFWNATPEEVATVIEALSGGAPAAAAMTRNELDSLERMFPDG